MPKPNERAETHSEAPLTALDLQYQGMIGQWTAELLAARIGHGTTLSEPIVQECFDSARMISNLTRRIRAEEWLGNSISGGRGLGLTA